MADNKLLKALFGTEKVLMVIPGMLIAVAVMLLALVASRYLGAFFKAQLNLQKSPVSTFLLAIILGMVIRNIIRFPKIFEPGFKFCVAKLLRLGIILLGIRLSILAIAKIGLVAVIVVIICITSGIVLASLFARAFKVSNRLGTLIAAGTAICGVSAIVATSPAIGAREEETAYATNLEAAREVARQLRLRDIGGLVVVDFIDMRSAKHRRAVEKTMRDSMKDDKARTHASKLSDFYGHLVFSQIFYYSTFFDILPAYLKLWFDKGHYLSLWLHELHQVLQDFCY